MGIYETLIPTEPSERALAVFCGFMHPGDIRKPCVSKREVTCRLSDTGYASAALGSCAQVRLGFGEPGTSNGVVHLETSATL